MAIPGGAKWFGPERRVRRIDTHDWLVRRVETARIGLKSTAPCAAHGGQLRAAHRLPVRLFSQSNCISLRSLLSFTGVYLWWFLAEVRELIEDTKSRTNTKRGGGEGRFTANLISCVF